MKTSKFRKLAISTCVLALCTVMGLAISNGWGHTLLAQAEDAVMTPAAGEVIRAGSEITIEYRGEQAEAAHLLPTSQGLDGGDVERESWLAMEILEHGTEGSKRTLRVKLPNLPADLAEGTFNDSEIRLSLPGNNLLFSQPFVLDGTPPKVRLNAEKTYVKRVDGEYRLQVAFVPVGPDVKNVRLEMKSLDDPAREVAKFTMDPEVAQNKGFPVEADGSYDLSIIAVDRVDNESDPSTSKIEGFVIDTTKPRLSVDLKSSDGGELGGYVVGGENVQISWSIDELYPDYETFRLDYIDHETEAVRGTISAIANRASTTHPWEVPYEDISRFRVRVSMRDEHGNYASATSGVLTMFSQAPQAYISDDANAPTFQIKYVPAEPLMALHRALMDQGFDFKVDIWQGSPEDSPVNWSDAIEDTDFVLGQGNGRSAVIASTQKDNKAFAARLRVVPTATNPGAAAWDSQPEEVIARWNALTEAAPNAAGAPPESVFPGTNRIARVTMNPLADGRGVYLRAESIELGYTVSDFLNRNSTWHFEYRIIGQDEWNRIDQSSSETGSGILRFSLGRSAPLVQVRAVTVFDNGRGTKYQVYDVLGDPITVDSDSPTDATIVRVTDEVGREITNGAFTNSPFLNIEYRGTDTVNGQTGSGIQKFRLWDTAPEAFYNQARGSWNGKEFSAGLSASDQERALPATENSFTVNFEKLGKANLYGTLSFLLEGVDFAGNSKFKDAKPTLNSLPSTNIGAAREPSSFTVRVDRVAPDVSVDFVSGSERADSRVKSGDSVYLTWTAEDMGPNGENGSSMPDLPVVIYVLDDRGNPSRYIDNLPATHPGYEVQVPALAGSMTIRFLVTAVDHAGNETDFLSERAKTRPIAVDSPKRPNVTLNAMPVSRTDQVELALSWRNLGEVEAEQLDRLVLWHRVEDGGEWQIVQEYDFRGVVDRRGRILDYKLDRIHGYHLFTLTAVGTDNLEEPQPTSASAAEMRIFIDSMAPMVADATMLPASQGDQPYVTGSFPKPRVRFTITDETPEHFDAQGVEVMVTDPNGNPLNYSNRLTGVANGAPVEVEVPSEVVGAYKVSISATDSQGNTSRTVTLNYSVRRASQWEIITNWLDRTDPIYCKSSQIIEWKRRGESAEKSITLALETISFDGDGELAAGNRVWADENVPDIEYYDWQAVPMVPSGQYQLVLRAVDISGEVVVDRMGPFTIEEPNPRVQMVLDDQGAGHAPPLLLKDNSASGGASEYGIDGGREVRFRLMVEHLRSNGETLKYPFGPSERRVEKGVRIFYRHSPLETGGITGPVEQIDDMVFEGPNTAYPVIAMGSLSVGFNPQRGDGRYAIYARFVDEFGFSSPEITLATKPDAIIVVDSTPPAAESHNVAPDGDSTKPKTRILQTGASREVRWQVNDPNLDVSTVRIEVRPYGEPDVTPQIFKLTTDQQGNVLPRFRGMTEIGDVTKLELADVGRYHVTLVAADLLGNVGRSELGGDLFFGRADYFALRPIEVENSLERYTNESVSRKESFRILLNYHHSWDDGLASVTLWSRPQGGVWQSKDFNLANVTRNETALPFTATQEGVWEFTVTTTSRDGRSEIPSGMSIDELGVEKQVMVYFGGLRATDVKLAPLPNSSEEVKQQFKDGSLAAGQSYLVTWNMSAGVFAHTLNYSLAISTDGGQNYGSEQMLERSRTGKADLYKYIVSPVRMLEDNREEKSFSVIWRCPQNLLSKDIDGLTLRLTAQEQSNTLPELTAQAFSIKYNVDAERKPLRELPAYYIESRDFGELLMKAVKATEDDDAFITTTDAESGDENFVLDDSGNKLTRKAAIALALKKFKAAQREADTAEVQVLLSNYYKYTGDTVKADYHYQQSLLRKSEDDYREGRWDESSN